MEKQLLINILMYFLYDFGWYSAHDKTLDISGDLISKIPLIVS